MTTKNGRFVWYELMTTDPEAARAFYGEVIGWKTQPFGSAGDYQMWVGSQGPLGGVMTLPAGTGATLTYGAPVVGRLGTSGAEGYIGAAVASTAAEANIARGQIVAASDTANVRVQLP